MQVSLGWSSTVSMAHPSGLRSRLGAEGLGAVDIIAASYGCVFSLKPKKWQKKVVTHPNIKFPDAKKKRNHDEIMTFS